MTRRLRTAAVVGTVIVGLALAGCGGGSDDGDTKGDKKADEVTSFKKSAGEICKATRADLEKAAGGIADPKNPTKAELTAVAGKIAEYIGAEATDLGKLDPPDDLADGMAAYLANLTKVAAAAKDKGADFIDPATQPFAASNNQAAELGLADCVL
jgi:hypothetical protein